MIMEPICNLELEFVKIKKQFGIIFKDYFIIVSTSLLKWKKMDLLN